LNSNATATAGAIRDRAITKLILPNIGADPADYIALSLTQTEFRRVRRGEAPRWRRLVTMKRIAATMVIAILGFACAKAMAADAVAGAAAPYNEAVRIVDGKRVVEVAPFPDHWKSAVRTFKRPDEHPPLAGYYHVVETPQGLMDCLGTPWYHPKACSPSSFGREKYLREWTVKMHGQWFACVGQAKPKACVPLVGDGVLRGLPTGVPE